MSEKERTRPMRLRRGNHFINDGSGLRKLEVGEVVELNDRQCKAFADRFESPDLAAARELVESENAEGEGDS